MNTITYYSLDEAREIIKKEEKEKKALRREKIKSIIAVVLMTICIFIIFYNAAQTSGHYEGANTENGNHYIWVAN